METSKGFGQKSWNYRSAAAATAKVELVATATGNRDGTESVGNNTLSWVVFLYRDQRNLLLTLPQPQNSDNTFVELGVLRLSLSGRYLVAVDCRPAGTINLNGDAGSAFNAVSRTLARPLTNLGCRTGLRTPRRKPIDLRLLKHGNGEHEFSLEA